MLRFLDVVKDDGQQDSAKLHDLHNHTENQARKIQALYTKVAQLELASTPSTGSALQDNLDSL